MKYCKWFYIDSDGAGNDSSLCVLLMIAFDNCLLLTSDYFAAECADIADGSVDDCVTGNCAVGAGDRTDDPFSLNRVKLCVSYAP